MPDAAREDRVTLLVDRVRLGLPTVAEPAKAPSMQAYMKSALPYLGVTADPLKKFLRTALSEPVLPDRATWERAVRTLWDEATYREERYAAEALAGHRLYRDHRDIDAVPLYEHLITTGAWWDHVDNLAIHQVGPMLDADRPGMTPVVRRWSTADDMWLRRSSVICQVGLKDDVDTALLRECIEVNLDGSAYGKEFFIRKAIGWALRQHARVDPAWVVAFVSEHEDRLSGLSKREALKHL